MPKPYRGLALGLVFVLMFILPAFSAGTAQTLSSGTRLFSHRGLGTPFPENSLPAIRYLIEKGIHGTEVDLRTTKDNTIVLLHDETLDRTTTGSGKVSEASLEQLRGLKLKEASGKPTDCRIPEFTQVLDLVRAHPGFELALDLKAVDAVAAADMVLEKEMAGQVTFFIADPMDTDLAQSLTRLSSQIRLVVDVLTWWKIEDVPLFAAMALKADTLFASEWFFPGRGFKALARKGVPVTVYLWGTHDLESRFTRAVDLGARSVSTDDPIRLLLLVGSGK